MQTPTVYFDARRFKVAARLRADSCGLGQARLFSWAPSQRVVVVVSESILLPSLRVCPLIAIDIFFQMEVLIENRSNFRAPKFEASKGAKSD